MTELEAWLIWLRAPDIGAARLRFALNRFGSMRDALQAEASEWHKAGATAASVAWLKRPDSARIDADLRWLEVIGQHLLICESEDFPPLLGRIPSAPAALFVRGDITALWRPQIAIVGSRNASAGGRATARDFASALVRAGMTITSGMAEGIDGAAHAAALDAGGLSVAVVGTGADVIYPRKHMRLVERLLEQQGALVSEFPLGTPGKPENFPRRNRIISGLCLGTLVVEAGLQSGSLITARLASEQGREVFAIPGSIHNPMARGCHRLLRDGAKLVESAADVLEELQPLATELGAKLNARLHEELLSAPRSRTTEEEKLLWSLGFDPVDFDTLLDRSGLTAAVISSILVTLELEGEVALLAGNYYQRIRFTNT